MRIGRTLPPAASPIPLTDIFRALPTCLRPNISSDKFEQEIQQEFSVRYSFLVSSGKAALTLSLLALKEIYPERKQVVLPAFTCYSVPAAVKRAGLQIRLCDLAPHSLDLDKEKLREIIEEDKQQNNVLCVIPTHLFGCPADIDGIREIIGLEIPIVEDAAQAMGEAINNSKLGTLGDIGFYSLGRGKALSTMEGGIIVTNRKDLANSIRSLIGSLRGYTLTDVSKLLFKTILTAILLYPSLFWIPKALPFLRLGETFYEPEFPLRRLSSFHIKLARNWQRRLARHRQARIRNISYLQNRLPADFTQLCKSTNIGLVRLPVLVKSRERRSHILQQSEKKGLGLMLAYPETINKIPELTAEFVGAEYPQAEEVCSHLLTIPVHEYIHERDNERILSCRYATLL